MSNPLRALIVEDSESDCALLLRILEKGGYQVTHERVDSADALKARLREQKWNLVISDFSMPGFNGVAALAIVRENDPYLPLIFLSGTIGAEIAVEAMRTGAQDYVLKGNAARLIPSIQRSLAEARFAERTNPRNSGCGNWKNSRLLANWREASLTISTT